MSLTIHLDENESVRMSDELIETQPPDQVQFVAEGTLTMTEELLGEFTGMSLMPTQVSMSIDESKTVPVDLTEEPSLRLAEVDVGVETPDTENISPGMDSINPTTDDSAASPDMTPGTIAFTIEGAILNVPRETIELLSERDPTLKSITFALDDAVKTDGGANNNVLLEFSLLGYGIVIYRNGTIEIGKARGVPDISRP